MNSELLNAYCAGVATASLAVGSMAWWTLRQRLGRAEREASTDVLTGLLNRRGWERTAGTRTNSTGGTQDLYVILADCNGLKQVNDTYGHEAGDELIADAATALRAAAPGAVIARLGGDEFALLVGWGLFETLRTRSGPIAATAEYPAAPHTVWSRLAMGAAPLRGDLDAAMSRADAAMYRNKATGEGPLCVFDPAADDFATADRPDVRVRDLQTHTAPTNRALEVA